MSDHSTSSHGGKRVDGESAAEPQLSLADELRLKRELLIQSLNKSLRAGACESTVEMLRDLQGCFHQAPPFIGSIPDANLVAIDPILALVESSDEQISIEAISTAICLLHFRDDHEHDLVERLCTLLKRGDNSCSLRAVAALSKCSVDASHLALPLIAELATTDNAALRDEICKFIAASGKCLVTVARQLASAITQLGNLEPQVDLLRSMLWGFDSVGVAHTEVARMICPPLSKELAVCLLGRVGPFGRPIREFLLTAGIDFSRPVAPLTVQRNPNRVFYPDGISDPIEPEVAEFLTKLIEVFPESKTLAELNLDTRKVKRMLKPHPTLRRYIQSTTGDGTRIRYRPLAADVPNNLT